MNTRIILLIFLAFMAIGGYFDAYFITNHIREPRWWVLTTTFGLSVIAYLWYYFDSESRSFSRSIWLNISVVAISIIAIPYYLVRSRVKWQKLFSLFKLMGFFILSIGLFAIGHIVESGIG